MSGQLHDIAEEIDHYLHRLFPITRSITGPGNRETLKILQEVVPIEIKEYPSGTPVYDWVIPDEWRVRDAWIKDDEGNRLVDFRESNIHLVSYSEPVKKDISFDELETHLHYHEELPEAIPYRTSYYKRDWGFCVNQQQYHTLKNTEGNLEVVIDSEFDSNGSLSVGELLIPGAIEQEILISTYICHPSLANDNLSGAVMTAFLARELMRQKDLKRSYRIVWVPETIGAIAYSAMNEAQMKEIQSGLVVTTVGGPGQYGYKQSYDVDHSVNRVIEEIFNEEGIEFISYPFDIHGSDERQYSTQGFMVNVASLTKDKYYEYPYYHTSLDNLDFVEGKQVARTLMLHLKVLDRLNREALYKSLIEECEVMLSKHDLYPKVGGGQLPESSKMSELDLILWILWLCDGERGIYQLTHRLAVAEEELKLIAARLCEKGVLEQKI